MNLLIKKSYYVLLLMVCSLSYGQMNTYAYRQEIKGIHKQWHKIELPNEIFGKTLQNLSDIRIFGITENKDTIEAPYLLHLLDEKVSSKKVGFRIINTSHNDKGYYFTFKLKTEELINQIELNFEKENFDWDITLEGSQDQNEWFTLIDNYRILSIKNNFTDFQFTKLTFPDAKYRFFRLLINANENPKLSIASISEQKIIDGIFKTHPIERIKITDNKHTQQSEVDIRLQNPVRISHINVGISDSFDYYRPITIKYLADSFKTEQGWQYSFNRLTKGTLNSVKKNQFQFAGTTVQDLKILVDNYDNQSLTIDTIIVKGYKHELIARFTEQATYYLTYGNKKSGLPHYDIERFKENIPKTLTSLELGNVVKIKSEQVSVPEPLFKNKAWLWSVMIAIILLLGGFSIKMIRTKQNV